MVDKHAFLNYEELGSNSNFTNPWMSWDGYYSWEHHLHVCQICNGQLKFQILHDLDNLKWYKI
jgi:hypothetical protein